MGLEIEFEYDDTQGGVWAGPAEPDLRGRLGRRWNSRLAAASPLFVQFGIAAAALVLGAASTAGYLAGRTAEQNRATLLLHLAPVTPFAVDPIPVPADLSPDVQRATPWTDVFNQKVTLTLVNDGPDPVSVLGVTVSAPEFRAARLTADSARIAPGGVSVLRGMAHFVCGDYPANPVGEADVSPAAATVAQLSVRTSDGRTRGETLQVDRYSDVAEQAVCQRMLGPEVVGTPVYTQSGAAGVYSVTVPVTNRAPFPLRAALSPTATRDWSTGAGLALSTAGAVTIPPHGTGPVTVLVIITDCTAAKQSAVQGFGFDTLAFTDALDNPDGAQTRQTDEALFMADHGLIVAYCDAGGAGR